MEEIEGRQMNVDEVKEFDSEKKKRKWRKQKLKLVMMGCLSF